MKKKAEGFPATLNRQRERRRKSRALICAAADRARIGPELNDDFPRN